MRPQSALNWLSPVEYEHLLSIYAAKVAWQWVAGMIGLCLGELPLGYFVLSPVHHAGRGSLSSKPWNKAVDFSKLTKYCDSFRFLKLFCVHFCWEGTPFFENLILGLILLNSDHFFKYTINQLSINGEIKNSITLSKVLHYLFLLCLFWLVFYYIILFQKTQFPIQK